MTPLVSRVACAMPDTGRIVRFRAAPRPSDLPGPFLQFADTLPIGIWLQEPDGSVAFTNVAWYELTGLPRDPTSHELDAWKTIIHPDDFERVVETMTRAVLSASDYAFELRLRRSGSDEYSYRWQYASAKMQDLDGAFSGWLGSIVDIEETHAREETERKLRLEAMRREVELQAFAESIPQIAWTADRSGAIEWYNQRWYEYTGQTKEEAAGWGWQSVHHPDDFPLTLKQWAEALRTGEPIEIEFRLKGRDGKFRWFLTLVHPSRDEAGNVVGWFGTNTDVHERKQHLERSKRIAQTLQEVFLPERLPQLPLMAFDAIYAPAESDAFVGGDWYDAFALENGNVVVSIGDVAGHGLDAAVIAGRIRQTIFTEAFNEDDPARILVKADRVLRSHTETTATAFVGIIDGSTGFLRYASAGHPPPIIASRSQAATFLLDGSLPLGTGFFPGGLRIETNEMSAPDDATFVLYTDGLTEVGRDLLVGERHLKFAVDRRLGTGEPFTARQLVDDVLGDRSSRDDIAVLLVRWKPTATSTVSTGEPLAKQWRFHSSHAQSAQASRHELMKFIRTHAAAHEDLFSTEIILGELLANTVEHAPGLVEISVDWTGVAPILTVRDSGPGFVERDPTLPASDLSEDGRGLYLIRELSQRFAIRAATAFGTEVDVELPISREPRA